MVIMFISSAACVIRRERVKCFLIKQILFSAKSLKTMLCLFLNIFILIPVIGQSYLCLLFSPMLEYIWTSVFHLVSRGVRVHSCGCRLSLV